MQTRLRALIAARYHKAVAANCVCRAPLDPLCPAALMLAPQTAGRAGRTLPRVPGGLPFIGHLVPFVRECIQLLHRARAACGDVAAFDVGPKKMVLLTGPEASEAFYRASDDVLNPSEAYKMMVPVFG